MFSIEVCYISGDSFGSSEVLETLEWSWEDEIYAKASLDRIITHAEWFYRYEGFWRRPPSNYIDPPSFVRGDYHDSLVILLDGNIEQEINCPWICPMFGEFIHARVITDKPQTVFNSFKWVN